MLIHGVSGCDMSNPQSIALTMDVPGMGSSYLCSQGHDSFKLTACTLRWRHICILLFRKMDRFLSIDSCRKPCTIRNRAITNRIKLLSAGVVIFKQVSVLGPYLENFSPNSS